MDGTIDDAELRRELEKLHADSYMWALSCCLGDAGLAEDALQVTYLKVLQRRARYCGRSTFKTWLFSVIRLTAIEERRRAWFRRSGLARYEKDRVPRDVPHLDLDSAERSEIFKVFQQALARLTARQREVLHLVFYQNLTLEDAAETMEVSLGSARTHYDRGKRKLRAWLGQTEYFNEYRRNK